MKQKLSLVLRFAETEWGEMPREWVTVIPEKRLSQIRFKRWKILAYTRERTTEVIRASCLARADFLFLVKSKICCIVSPVMTVARAAGAVIRKPGETRKGESGA